MRIAALAFGILAGLVASLILALGGLDPTALGVADGRQESLLRFFLFVIANFGVLGAGVALAAPLVGAILLVVGAIAWVVASILLHHGPDYVMLVPPALLLVATAFAILALTRRSSAGYDRMSEAQALAVQRAAMTPRRSIDDDDEEDEDRDEGNDVGRGGAVPVNATFFGDGGTATPMRGAIGRSAEPRAPIDDEPRADWEPVRRRTEPPRQKSVFRPPEDEYDDEETGLARVSRYGGSILTFGLYGALVAAGILIFLNLRNSEANHASATKIEASVSSKKATSSSALVAQSPAAPPSTSPAAAEATAPILSLPSGPSSAAPSLPTLAEASEPIIPAASAPTPPANSFASPHPGVVVAGADNSSSTQSDGQSAGSSQPDDQAANAAGSPDAAPMPFPMPAAIAAGQSAAATPPATAATTTTRRSSRPQADTGL